MNSLSSFNPQALANIVWAYATANVQHPKLFNTVGDEIAGMKNLHSFNAQALANTAWAYAVLNIDMPTMFNEHYVERLIDVQFTTEDLSQLHQWHLWQSEEKSKAGLPESFQEQCRQAFIGQNTTQSRFQDSDCRFRAECNGS